MQRLIRREGRQRERERDIYRRFRGGRRGILYRLNLNEFQRGKSRSIVRRLEDKK